MRLRAQIGTETQEHRCVTVITHLKNAEQMMKTCGGYTFCRSYGQPFFGTLKVPYSSSF